MSLWLSQGTHIDRRMSHLPSSLSLSSFLLPLRRSQTLEATIREEVAEEMAQQLVEVRSGAVCCPMEIRGTHGRMHLAGGGVVPVHDATKPRYCHDHVGWTGDYARFSSPPALAHGRFQF